MGGGTIYLVPPFLYLIQFKKIQHVCPQNIKSYCFYFFGWIDVHPLRNTSLYKSCIY